MSLISEVILERERQQLAWMIGFFFSKEKGAMTELKEAARQMKDDILFLKATGGSAALIRTLNQTAFAFDSRARMYLEQQSKHPEKDQYYAGRYDEAKEAQKILEDLVTNLRNAMMEADCSLTGMEKKNPDLREDRAWSIFRAVSRVNGSISVNCWTNDTLNKGYPTSERYWVHVCRTREEFDKLFGKSRVGCGCETEAKRQLCDEENRICFDGVIIDVYLDGEKL